MSEPAPKQGCGQVLRQALGQVLEHMLEQVLEHVSLLIVDSAMVLGPVELIPGRQNGISLDDVFSTLLVPDAATHVS